MARWASVRQVAEYLSMSEGAIRKHIAVGTGFGALFHKVGGTTLRADLDKIDEMLEDPKND